ncbi:MAG: dihydroxy-acid dehydratase, partial [Sneathiellales bacterium]|nr:dihydroxy-acid dehydratase [Sneathiellales bacterium]
DWENLGLDIPLLVNMQPAGDYLAEDFHRAGGVPAVIAELIKHKKLHENCPTVSGRTLGENCTGCESSNPDVIRSFETALVDNAGFKVIGGNLFDAAIMKLSVISDDFRDRYLSNPDDPMAFEGKAVVFDGPEDYHHRIDDPELEIDENTILFMRGTGPIGYPGAAEVVNMRAPDYLYKKGISGLPCIGDGRQSGTSGSPSILNASPEAAIGGGLSLLKSGDRVRVDLDKGQANILISEEEYNARAQQLAAEGGYKYPDAQTPWQELQRGVVDQLSEGMVLKNALKFQRISSTKGLPRDNH